VSGKGIVLETRNVFIDTQHFVQTGLYFDNPALKSFRELCEFGELFHITTSVVMREVESHINLSVKEALNAMQTFKRKARILSSLNDGHIKSLFSEVLEEDMYMKANDIFLEFIKGCHTKCIDASCVDSEAILNLYFDRNPPFGEGKKKSEFPDAFSLLSLKSYSNKKNEKIYVISEDLDVKSFCDSDSQLKSINSLAKVLDLYNEHTNTITAEVKQYFVTNVVFVKEEIKDYLEKCDVYNSLWNDAFEVWQIEVINVGDIDPSILSIRTKEIEIMFDVMVQFEVMVESLDTYFGEDGRPNNFPVGWEYVTSVKKKYSVEVNLSYEFINEDLNILPKYFYIADAANGIDMCEYLR
jgi:hypothetical protein